MAGSARFEIKKNKKGGFYFVLKAANNEVIATSEAYATKAGALNGIKSVATNAPVAAVLDDTAGK